MSQQLQKTADQQEDEKLQRPKTLLTDEEIEKGNIAFVALVKARKKLIDEAKKAKGITDADS